MSRSIEALVDEQVRRWQLLRQKPEGVEIPPVITVTGQHGALGDELSRRLASELGFDHFDREIIHRVAESAHLSERVVASIDGKRRELLTDWLAAVASPNYLSPAEYRYHLARVIGAIAHQGGAVILGRGAHLLLRRGALRVLAVAPLEDRVRTVMEQEGLSERDARRRIVEVESDRHAFILMHYHAEFADPTAFDVVVNTAALGLDAASAAIRATLATWRARPGRPGAGARGAGEDPNARRPAASSRR
jgi:cytidylate kinase